MTEEPYEAAWVPYDDPGRPWDDAVELAVAWVEERAREEGRRPRLVTPEKRVQLSGPEPLVRFAKRYNSVTPRGRGASGAPGPTLAYVPDYPSFERAARLARGSSLCVVEWPSDPMLGWAVQMEALDLTTGQVTPDHRSPELIELLDHLHSYGNNGWAGGFGRDRARQLLPEILKLETPGGVLAYMLARGAFATSVQNLRQIIKRLSAHA